MRYLLTLLVSAVVAYLIGFILTVPANPEIHVWRQVDQRRDAEIEAVRKKAPDRSVIVFTGGSSTAFSIDAALIEESCGTPAFNFSLPVSAGPKYLLHHALERTRPGDTLVIGLEPDLLAFESDYDASMFSFGLAALDGEPSASVGGSTFGNVLSPSEALTLARPGPRYLLTLLYRSGSGAGYRYSLADYRARGRMETQVKNPDMRSHRIDGELHLSKSGSRLLRSFSEAAHRRGVRLFYTMPWRWTEPDHATASRKANAGLLREIDLIIPVLDDGAYGVSTDRSHFSDSNQHLTAAGSIARTRALASILERRMSLK